MSGPAVGRTPPLSLFYAIHPREDLAHVVRWQAGDDGRPRGLRLASALIVADCGAQLGKDWQGWALVPERDFPLAAAPGFPRPVVDVCEACKSNAPAPEPPSPELAAPQVPERPPRKASEIAADLERIRDEVRSPRLQYFLTRAIGCLRGKEPSASSRTAGAAGAR